MTERHTPEITSLASATWRLALLVLGSTLMVAAPLAGVLPGPGGIVVFAIGLGLVLRNSLWARRRYVDFKRRFPKPGDWIDWGMQRKSPKRRKAVSKASPKADL